MMKDKLTLLHKTTANYIDQEKENFNTDYLEKIIIKANELEIEASNELLKKIDVVLLSLPIKTIGKKLKYKRKCLNDIANLKSFVKEKFNIISKGYYRKKYVSLGLALGPSFGVLIGIFVGNIAICLAMVIPIAMAFGITIGNYHDEKAKNENRVI